MSWLNRIAVVGTLLIATNVWSDNFIFDRLGGVFVNNLAEILNMVRCGVGLALFPPTMDIHVLGRAITIVYPTISSVIYTIIVTVSLLWLLSLVQKANDVSPSQIILLVIIVWTSLKAIGLILIKWSGPWCLGLMVASRDVLNPFYQAGLFITPFFIVKMIWEKFFGK